MLSRNIYGDARERDLQQELSPKLYTYLVINYYDILRAHGTQHYNHHLEPILLELGCHVDENATSKFNNILLNSQSATEFATNVSKNFECY